MVALPVALDLGGRLVAVSGPAAVEQGGAALSIGLTLHALAAITVAAGAGAAYVVELQERGVAPAVALTRARQQRGLIRLMQWGVTLSLLTGLWLVVVLGWGVLLHPWLLLKILLLLLVAGMTGAVQARTQRRRMAVLSEMAAGDRDPSLAAELAVLRRRGSTWFAIILPAVALLILLGIFKPF